MGWILHQRECKWVGITVVEVQQTYIIDKLQTPNILALFRKKCWNLVNAIKYGRWGNTALYNVEHHDCWRGAHRVQQIKEKEGRLTEVMKVNLTQWSVNYPPLTLLRPVAAWLVVLNSVSKNRLPQQDLCNSCHSMTYTCQGRIEHMTSWALGLLH